MKRVLPLKIVACVVFLVFFIPAVSSGEDRPGHDSHSSAKSVEALSPALRDLLSKEMKALQDGMMSIIPAYISGNWQEIEATAGKMKSSYILRQSLTDVQVKELHSVLPQAFVEKDQHFHYLAGMLAHAAKNKKAELINFYFSEMNESCLGCHAVYASHRFPGLSLQEKPGDHRH